MTIESKECQFPIHLDDIPGAPHGPMWPVALNCTTQERFSSILELCYVASACWVLEALVRVLS